MIRRPPRCTPIKSSAASDVYKRQPDLRGLQKAEIGDEITVVLKIRSQNGKYVNDVAIVD